MLNVCLFLFRICFFFKNLYFRGIIDLQEVIKVVQESFCVFPMLIFYIIMIYYQNQIDLSKICVHSFVPFYHMCRFLCNCHQNQNTELFFFFFWLCVVFIYLFFYFPNTLFFFLLYSMVTQLHIHACILFSHIIILHHEWLDIVPIAWQDLIANPFQRQ